MAYSRPMGFGFLDAVSLGATLVFALPVALMGLEKAAGGQTALAAGLLVVATLMVVLPQYLTTPQDVPEELAERVVGTVVEDPDEGE